MNNTTHDLREYVRIVKKRKWLILLPVFVCVIGTGAVSYFVPPKWEVDCLIKPAHILIQSSSGTLSEVVVSDPKQISELINQGAYTMQIASQMNISIERIPKLKADNLKNTSLIRLLLRSSDVAEGRAIILSMFYLLKKDMDNKINTEIKSLETLVADHENEIVNQELNIKEKLNNIIFKKNDVKLKKIEIKEKDRQKQEKKLEIKSQENFLKISQERSKEVLDEMATAKERIKRIEDLQTKIGPGEEKNAFSLFFYAKEIQENWRYCDTLSRELSEEKINQEELKLGMVQKEQNMMSLEFEIEKDYARIETFGAEIKGIENDIDKIRNAIKKIQNNILLLVERKARFDYSQLVKEPTPSLSPVFPKKLLNALIAAVLSLALFTLLAFILEYTAEQSPENKDR